jgi:N-acetylglutamate synthase-like GNAT family acetyltransferase
MCMTPRAAAFRGCCVRTWQQLGVGTRVVSDLIKQARASGIESLFPADNYRG